MGGLPMALLLLAGWGLFAWSAWRRWRLLMVGAPANRLDRPAERLRLTFTYAIAQLRMRRYPLAGFAHMLIFLGFGVLLLRTLILWGRGFDLSFDFWIFSADQPLGRIYGLLKDAFALLVIFGVLVFFYYRLVKKLPRMTLSTEGLVILGIILAMMLADILYDGASMVRAARAAAGAGGPVYAFHAWEPAGSAAQFLVAGLPGGAVMFLAHLGFWTHSALVLIFLNILPYSKHFHIITGVPNVYTQSLDPPGRLEPINDIDGKLEREETLGIRRIDQFSWKSILDFYTCTECGRCSDHCPATKTGKKLSPKHFTIDLRNFLYEHDKELTGAKVSINGRGAGPATEEGKEAPPMERTGGDAGPTSAAKDLVGSVIDPEVLWACTTCRACEQECPVFISFVDKIVDMRRYLVMERSEFPSELQTAFQSIESTGNPWAFPAEDRAKWAEGLNIPTLAEKPDAEYLFWSGCMPSYDERAKKVTRATVELMQKAGVSFAILGREEQCTGDPARRAGYEYLYQMLAKANCETLNGYGVDKKKIVTSCPHCFNTIKNEYPDFGGKFEVVHHTQLLDSLVRAGRLKPTQPVPQRVAYHDSCYMGRHNGEYDAPRNILSSIPGLKILEPVQTRDRGMCCGAGGAQMFKEEEPGKKRVNEERTEQLLATDRPSAVASNCPFCMRMLTDGLAGKGKEDVVQLDVAELLHQAVMGDGNAETRKHGNAETA